MGKTIEGFGLRLCLGCGKRDYGDRFTHHIDAVEYPHINCQSPVEDLELFEDGSAILVYVCHVLEHFPRRHVRHALREWARVLDYGGVCRISVPDFDALCKVYMTRKNFSEVVGPIMGRQDYLYNIHNSLFTYDLLSYELVNAGFSKVRKYDWRKTEHADIDDYSQAYIPHMDKVHGTLISLNVEAVK